MLKLPQLRATRHTIQDFVTGVAMFTIMLLIVGFMSLGSLGALSTDALSFQSSAHAAAAPPARATASANQATQPNSEARMGVLATPPYYRASVVPSFSFSDSSSSSPIAILMLAMMFALIGVFVRRSVRHLRRRSVPSSRQDWSRQ